MRRVGPQTNTAGGGGGAFFTATSKIEQNGTSFENNLAGIANKSRVNIFHVTYLTGRLGVTKFVF